MVVNSTHTVAWAAFACAVALVATARAQSSATESTPLAWRSEALHRALDATAQISDRYRQAEAYARIARAQASADDLHGAYQSIERATSAARDVSESSFRGWLEYEIVLAQLAAQDEYGARQTTERIGAQQAQDAAFTQLMQWRLRRGDSAGAQALAAQIRERAARSEARRLIVAHHASLDDVQAANALLPQIEDAQSQAMARGDVASALIRAGDVARAVALAARAPRRHRQEVYGRIAVARAQQGDAAGALETLQRVREPRIRAPVLAAIAVEVKDAGRASRLYETALRDSANIKDVRTRAHVLALIARLRLPAAERTATLPVLKETLEEVEAAPLDAARDGALDYLGHAYARLGERDSALRCAELLHDRILRALLVRDLVALDRSTTVAALEMSARFDDPLMDAAAVFGALGARPAPARSAAAELLETASVVVSRIEDAAFKPAAYAALAAAQLPHDAAKAEALFDDALGAAARLDQPEQRAAAYLRMLDALNERLVFLGKPAEVEGPVI